MTQTDSRRDTTEILPGLATQKTRWQRFLALSLLATATLFSGVVVGVLAATWREESRTGYPESATLKDLQEKVARNPRDEDLKTVLRNEDLRIRQAQDVREKRFQTGAWLLLAGLAASAVSGRWYASLDQGLPKPRKTGEEVEKDGGLSPRARGVIAVGAVGASLVAAVFLMSVDWTAKPRPAATFKDNWPRFRGPTGMGIVPAGDWPRTWDGASGKNILWKTEVPLSGKSSPVVWGDRVFVTGGDRRMQKLFCYDRTSGMLLWETRIATPEGTKFLGPESQSESESESEEKIEVSPDTGYAAPTPVTDGKRVYVVFATADIAAVDFSGKVAWQRNLGKPENTYGLASSPAMYKDKVIFQFDQSPVSEDSKNKSALLCIDAATGNTVWQTERPVGSSWSSPVVAETDAGPIIITCGSPWIIAYECESGGELWRSRWPTADVAVSPVYAAGKVFVTNDNAQIMAIRTGGKGDVTETMVAWTASEKMPDASSPVCDGKYFLQTTQTAQATCFDAATGKLLWNHEFSAGFWSSPALAHGIVYATDTEGRTSLFGLADKYEGMGENKLGETVHATPAFADGQIFMRGTKHLFCIGEKR